MIGKLIPQKSLGPWFCGTELQLSAFNGILLGTEAKLSDGRPVGRAGNTDGSQPCTHVATSRGCILYRMLLIVKVPIKTPRVVPNSADTDEFPPQHLCGMVTIMIVAHRTWQSFHRTKTATENGT